MVKTRTRRSLNSSPPQPKRSRRTTTNRLTSASDETLPVSDASSPGNNVRLPGTVGIREPKAVVAASGGETRRKRGRPCRRTLGGAQLPMDSNTEDDELPSFNKVNSEFSVGDLVWVKFRHYTFWPAVVCPSFPKELAPCGLRGCKNRPAQFPGRMLYKATKTGLGRVARTLS